MLSGGGIAMQIPKLVRIGRGYDRAEWLERRGERDAARADTCDPLPRPAYPGRLGTYATTDGRLIAQWLSGAENGQLAVSDTVTGSECRASSLVHGRALMAGYLESGCREWRLPSWYTARVAMASEQRALIRAVEAVGRTRKQLARAIDRANKRVNTR